MARSSEVSKIVANGNGVATVFSFNPVVIFESANLVVVLTTTAGVDTPLTEGTGATNYSVSVASYPGVGSITYPASGGTPLPAGDRLTIRCKLSLLQQTTLNPQGGYNPATQEKQFDRFVAIDQQQQEQLDRAPKLAPTNQSILSTEIEGTPTATKVIAVNSAGTGLVWAAAASAGPTGAQGPQGLSGAGTGDMLAAQNLNDLVNKATARVNLGVEIGVAIQAFDAELAAIAGLVSAANKFPMFTGAGTAGMIDFKDEDDMLSDSATAVPSQQSVKAYVLAQAVTLILPPTHLSGLTLSNNVADASNDIDIAAGSCRSLADTANMKLASGIIKRLDAAWVVGTNQGGLDTGVEASSTSYHVWVIKRTDTNVVDVLFSLSATAPTMPAGYTEKRRIGSIYNSAGSIILPFDQRGNEFWLRTPVLDINVSNPGTAAVTRTLSTMPLDVENEAILNAGISQTGGNLTGLYLSSLAAADLAVSLTAAPLATVTQLRDATGGDLISVMARVWTNTARQIRSRVNISGVNTNVRIAVLGWRDLRDQSA